MDLMRRSYRGRRDSGVSSSRYLQVTSSLHEVAAALISQTAVAYQRSTTVTCQCTATALNSQSRRILLSLGLGGSSRRDPAETRSPTRARPARMRIMPFHESCPKEAPASGRETGVFLPAKPVKASPDTPDQALHGRRSASLATRPRDPCLSGVNVRRLPDGLS